MNEVRVTASHRLELAGDWSDLPEYNLNGTGRVINVAVEIPGLIVEARASITETAGIEIISEDRGCSEELPSISDLHPTSPGADPLFLSKAVLCSYLQLSSGRGFADTQHWVFGAGRGLRIATNSTAPLGSGLGTSSILAATLFFALGHLTGSPLSEADACWHTYEMERARGLGSGWQDQIGGMIPGIKDITCTEGNRLTIRSVTAPQSLLDQLAKFTVLSFTNRTRFSGTILNEVNGLIRTDRKARAVIDSLKAICRPTRRAISAGRYDELGRYLRVMTGLQQQLHPGIVPEDIMGIFREVEDLCYGARVCGAGGSGFLVFFARGEAEKASLLQALEAAGYRNYPCSVGKGATVTHSVQMC